MMLLNVLIFLANGIKIYDIVRSQTIFYTFQLLLFLSACNFFIIERFRQNSCNSKIFFH